MSTARDKVIQARTALVLYHPFFAHLALRLELVEDPQCPTCWTDGVKLGYNPAFVERLTPSQLKGVICHEVMHCVAGHPWRRGGRDPRRWNWACDYAIDPIILQAGLDLPYVGGRKGHSNPAYRGLSAEEIYALLPPGLETPCYGEVRDGQEGVGGAKQQKEWAIAAVQAAEAVGGYGKLPQGLEAVVKGLLAPTVDWKAVLARFVQTHVAFNDYTYQMPNTRYLPLGCYLPSLRQPQGYVVLAVDTSGSITIDDLKRFGSEIAGVLWSLQATVLYFDAAIQRVQDYMPGETLEFRPCGRGGTSFVPVFEWIEKEGTRPDCLVVFTDADGEYPPSAPDYPVLWAVVGSGKPPFGEVIRIEAEE